MEHHPSLLLLAADVKTVLLWATVWARERKMETPPGVQDGNREAERTEGKKHHVRRTMKSNSESGAQDDDERVRQRTLSLPASAAGRKAGQSPADMLRNSGANEMPAGALHSTTTRAQRLHNLSSDVLLMNGALPGLHRCTSLLLFQLKREDGEENQQRWREKRCQGCERTANKPREPR